MYTYVCVYEYMYRRSHGSLWKAPEFVSVVGILTKVMSVAIK